MGYTILLRRIRTLLRTAMSSSRSSPSPSSSTSSSQPTLLSLDEFRVHLSKPVARHLLATSFDSSQKLNKNEPAQNDSNNQLERFLTALKTPPNTCTCRVNRIRSTKDQVKHALQAQLEQWIQRSATVSAEDNDKDDDPADDHEVEFSISEHDVLDDVLVVSITTSEPSLAHCRGPPQPSSVNNDDSVDSLQKKKLLFANWPARKQAGWPLTHRVVVVDRFCGEAVLRGADIYCRGVLVADAGLSAGEIVAVYAHVNASSSPAPPQGLLLQHYSGTCLFLGLGRCLVSRADCFRQDRGVAIGMSPVERAGPVLPPVHDLVAGQGFFQNLPSMMVAHVLDPQAHGEVILDMCAAPGGKTLHLASLVHGQKHPHEQAATRPTMIVACDRSRQKVRAMQDLFAQSGAANCITALALDSTKACLRDNGDNDNCTWKSAQEVLQNAETATDGLLCVKYFHPNSFVRILLDPPCSALGLRPKLQVPISTVQDLEAFVKYQRRFIHEAVRLLKPGGIMTYSTCTIHALENEGMVRHVLDEYGDTMELVPIDIPLGRPGLAHAGLNDTERSYVRRFDPADEDADTIGFFLSKFKKKDEDNLPKNP